MYLASGLVPQACRCITGLFKIYTSILGFESREFNQDAQLAIVVSPVEPHGTALLLEPCSGTFAEQYQKSVMEARLPIVVFGVTDVTEELRRLSEAGVMVRPDLDKPEWALQAIHKSGCSYVFVRRGIPRKGNKKGNGL